MCLLVTVPGEWRKLSGIMDTLIRLSSCSKLVTVFSLHYTRYVEDTELFTVFFCHF